MFKAMTIDYQKVRANGIWNASRLDNVVTECIKRIF